MTFVEQKKVKKIFPLTLLCRNDQKASFFQTQNYFGNQFVVCSSRSSFPSIKIFFSCCQQKRHVFPRLLDTDAVIACWARLVATGATGHDHIAPLVAIYDSAQCDVYRLRPLRASTIINKHRRPLTIRPLQYLYLPACCTQGTSAAPDPATRVILTRRNGYL